MKKKIRILVVDNIADFRETLVRIVSKLCDEVDSAGNLEDAVALIRARTYDLALVDLSLRETGFGKAEDDFENIDGVNLVRMLKSSGEGTMVMVLSGQPKTQVVADVLQKCRADSFMSKHVLRSTAPGDGFDLLVAQVKEHLQLARINILDGHDNALRCLTSGQDTDIWIDQALRAFSPTYGQDGLKRYFTDLVNQYGPVRQQCGMPWAITPDMRNGRAWGMYWSKALGAAVLAVFGSSRAIMEEEIAARAPNPLPEVLHDLVEYNIHGRLFLLPDQPRSAFREP